MRMRKEDVNIDETIVIQLTMEEAGHLQSMLSMDESDLAMNICENIEVFTR